jgi:hypothetical protein
VHTLGVSLYTGATVKVAIVRVATVKVASQTVLDERAGPGAWFLIYVVSLRRTPQFLAVKVVLRRDDFLKVVLWNDDFLNPP